MATIFSLRSWTDEVAGRRALATDGMSTGLLREINRGLNLFENLQVKSPVREVVPEKIIQAMAWVPCLQLTNGFWRRGLLNRADLDPTTMSGLRARHQQWGGGTDRRYFIPTATATSVRIAATAPARFGSLLPKPLTCPARGSALASNSPGVGAIARFT